MKELLFSRITDSVVQTESLGSALAEQMLADASLPPFVALYGDLGVGKTAFVRGFTSKISPAAAVRSPTFALVNEYRAKPRSVFHFDMYRINTFDDLYSTGFFDYLDSGAVLVIEWSENVIDFIGDENIITIEIKRLGDTEREITVERGES